MDLANEYGKDRWLSGHFPALTFSRGALGVTIVVAMALPVVLVHGTPWSSYNLRHLIEALAKDFTVYYYDRLGYGQSDKTLGDVSLGIQNRVLAGFLDHGQLERPAIIGHDFGGATVLRTHLLNGRDFERLVLIDPVAISPWGSPFFRHVQRHEAAFSF